MHLATCATRDVGAADAAGRATSVTAQAAWVSRSELLGGIQRQPTLRASLAANHPNRLAAAQTATIRGESPEAALPHRHVNDDDR